MLSGLKSCGVRLTALSRTLAVSVPLAVVSASASDAAHRSDACAHRVEREAVALRVAQTQLMVAALSCPESKRPMLRAAYNRFVSVEAVNLRRSTPVLQAFVTRNQLGTTDRYVTDLANDIALEAALTPDFCALTEKTVRELGSLDGMLTTSLPFAAKANDLLDCGALYADRDAESMDVGDASNPVLADDN